MYRAPSKKEYAKRTRRRVRKQRRIGQRQHMQAAAAPFKASGHLGGVDHVFLIVDGSPGAGCFLKHCNLDVFIFQLRLPGPLSRIVLAFD